VLYGTTPEFLERLGLPSLSALPSLAPLLDAVDEDGEEPGELAPEVADAAEAEADAVHAAVSEALAIEEGAETGDDVAPAGSLGDMATLGGESDGDNAAEPVDDEAAGDAEPS
jgi:hypothetical protein